MVRGAAEGSDLLQLESSRVLLDLRFGSFKSESEANLSQHLKLLISSGDK
jgi:hypothetical protein